MFLNYYQSTEHRLLTVDKVLNNNNIDVYIAMVEGGQLNEPTMTRFQIMPTAVKKYVTHVVDQVAGSATADCGHRIMVNSCDIRTNVTHVMGDEACRGQ